VYCYGVDGGASLFASIEAPTLFKTDLSRFYTLKPGPYSFDLVPRKCSDGST
jgi:chitinase